MNSLVSYQPLRGKDFSSKEFDSIGYLESFLRATSNYMKYFPTGKKLHFSMRFVSFSRYVALFILNKCSLHDQFKLGVKPGDISSLSPQISRAFMDYLLKLEVIEYSDNTYKLKQNYQSPLECDHYRILNAIDIKDWQNVIKLVDRDDEYSEISKDFLYIYLMNCVRYGEPIDIKLTKEYGVDEFWKNASGSSALYYEVTKAGAVIDLMRTDLINMIPTTNEDEFFFSNLGRMAFNSFTSDNFRSVIKQLNSKSNIESVLDIGSGFGDYINLVNSNFTVKEIHGVERQEAAYKKLEKRFKDFNNITIHNQDIMELDIERQVDAVFLIYVLFYFSLEQQLDLFKRLQSMLSDDGRIVVGQYYPHIEALRKEIAVANKDYGFRRKVDMFLANKLQYAEVMLNDSVASFDSAERWDLFNNMLDEVGLEVESITNADPYYYSIFVVIKKSHHL
ncbi:SAM-dependent methyltransferase [Vibrio sp. TRT 2004]|uniref:SAM-dependent methyltransferase n=1 Tax=Vibrio sp. TRT 2004 TaxID=3418506 RepID=UPI003CEB2586